MILIEILYVCSAVMLAVYGYNSLILALMRVKIKDSPPEEEQAENAAWPAVTIQLPVFNERFVVEGLIEAAGKLRYPSHLLQIQVLDDSTDNTREIIAAAVQKEKGRGVDIEHIRRPDRSGYKGGALEFGLKTAKGEFIAIFDADFLPQPDFLERMMPHLTDQPRVGCLQARWGHTNRDDSSLTRAQANGIDGHFVVEQSVRSEKGLFLNFNGTAGIWRAACIEDAGGWHHDTLTEDLDLSYRAQMKGWQIKYIPQVIVPAELPIHINAFKRQQFRWAKGSIQTARKNLRTLWRADIPAVNKIAGSIHLTHYLVHPLMLLNLVIFLPLFLGRSPTLWILPFYLGAALGPMLLYWVAMGIGGQSLGERIKNLGMLLLLGVGLSLNNTRAVIEALIGKQSAFLRTPKFNGHEKKNPAGIITYILPRDPYAWAEILLAAYSVGLLIYVLTQGMWSMIFWLLLYAAGYLYVASLNFGKE